MRLPARRESTNRQSRWARFSSLSLPVTEGFVFAKALMASQRLCSSADSACDEAVELVFAIAGQHLTGLCNKKALHFGLYTVASAVCLVRRTH